MLLPHVSHAKALELSHREMNNNEGTGNEIWNGGGAATDDI